MPDLNFQDFSSVQNSGQIGVRTIASAATVAPTTLVTIITGTTQLVTITPPVSGAHVLYLIFPDAMGVFATSGNIINAVDPGVNLPVTMVYNPYTGKYHAGPIS